MNRKEALTFLELPESATDKQIKKKLEEKKDFFERLCEHAPSAFLRRLNAQHLSKLMLIQEEGVLASSQTAIDIPGSTDLVVLDDSAEDNPTQHIMPVIISSALKPALAKEKEPVKEPIAFLVRHTENQSVKPFPLFVGKNYIGRRQHPSLKPFIALEEDEYVSRLHAVIFLEDKEPAEFYIDDSALSNEGKASKNGTFLNGNKQKVTDKTLLNENDTIQIGETKLILRINKTHINKIVEEIKDLDYMHTVVIRKQNIS